MRTERRVRSERQWRRLAIAWSAAVPLLALLALAACSSDLDASRPRDAAISEDIGSVFQGGTDIETLVEPGGRNYPVWR